MEAPMFMVMFSNNLKMRTFLRHHLFFYPPLFFLAAIQTGRGATLSFVTARNSTAWSAYLNRSGIVFTLVILSEEEERFFNFFSMLKQRKSFGSFHSPRFAIQQLESNWVTSSFFVIVIPLKIVWTALYLMIGSVLDFVLSKCISPLGIYIIRLIPVCARPRPVVHLGAP